MVGLSDMVYRIKFNSVGQLSGYVLTKMDRGSFKGIIELFKFPSTIESVLS